MFLELIFCSRGWIVRCDDCVYGVQRFHFVVHDRQRIYLSGTIMGSKPLAGILVLQFGSRPYDGRCVYGVPTDGSTKSDFEISYVSDSVGLELSVADFCLSTAFVRNSFLKDFLQSFASFSHLRWLCSLMSL